MVVPGDSPREMPEGDLVSSEGRGGGGLGCGEDDEIFLLPLTALAMEADDLRWVPYKKRVF